MSKTLSDEAATIQGPLIKHATDVGWTIVPAADALHKRGGEAGMFLYGELEEALLRLNPGIVTPDNVQLRYSADGKRTKYNEGNREMT